MFLMFLNDFFASLILFIFNEQITTRELLSQNEFHFVYKI